MSTTAEDISASLTDTATLESRADDVAALLMGDDEALTDDEKDDLSLPKTSTTEDDDDSNEELKAEEGEEQEEDTNLEAVADGDTTWEGVLGVSEESLSFDEAGNVAGFKTKVNGEEQIVSTADLIAGYQNNKHVTQKGQAHAEEVKQFAERKEQVVQEYTSKLETVDALTKHFEKQLISEYDNVNWEQLRVEDPAEYAAARHDFSVKAGEIQKVIGAIDADKKANNDRALEANSAANQQRLKTQYEAMLVNNPTWSDEKVLKEAQASHKGFVQDQYGFGDAEWDMVNDARLIELIKDAKKYHDGAKVAKQKTITPVPKFQKSRGKGKKPRVSKLEKLTAASRSATGEDKRQLQQSAVAELLLGGSQ